MELDLYQVDAFADRPFEGNPAAVVPLTEWPDDAVLTAIAAENNLSETAFFVRNADGLVLRWFTPAIEVALCGHATLATAHVLFTELTRDVDQIRFETRHSGPLIVRREGTGYTLDFPAQPLAETPVDPALVDALGVEPSALLSGEASPKWLVVLEDEAAVRGLEPDIAAIGRLPCLGVIVTAPGSDVDFVSRFFAPKAGVPEDPVTGSAHCVLTPYWAKRLGRQSAPMRAHQVSKRGGQLTCRLQDDRVLLTGNAVTVIRGKLRF